MFKSRNVLFLALVLSITLFAVACGPETPPEDQVTIPETGVSEDVDETTSEPEDIWADVQIVTEEYPPFNFTNEDGEIDGTSTEIIKNALEILEVNVPINAYPWSRAFEMAQNDKDVMIYSIGRTDEREDMFEWVSPIADLDTHFFALKENVDEIQINSLEDAKNHTIATVSNWWSEQGLEDEGFEQLLSSPNQNQSIRQLFEGRADLWVSASDEETIADICAEEGYDHTELEKIFTVYELRLELWIAANPQTSNEVIEAMREALETTVN